jgi:hypothetical protein
MSKDKIIPLHILVGLATILKVGHFDQPESPQMQQPQASI